MKIFVDQVEFEIEKKNGKNNIFKSGKLILHDIVHLGANRYSLIIDNQSYRVSFRKNNEVTEIALNGEPYTFQVEDERQKMFKTLVTSSSSETSHVEIKAPIPGMIVKILVKEGDTVSKDHGLLVLEAMKMENVIKSPGDCEIQEICVKEKASVEKGQILFRLLEK